MRFCRINTAHENATDLSSPDLEGKTPAELLPERVAETVVSNYTKCIETNKPYTYDELLPLPSGTRWWRTTLMPVVSGTTPIGLLGTAVDITSEKKIESDYAAALGDLGQINSDLQILVSTTAHDLRGPLRQAVLVNDMLMDGFEDLGDNKIELIELSSNVLTKALKNIDNTLSTYMEPTPKSQSTTLIDFGHWCRDMIAILDPLKRVRLVYPDVNIEAERFILDIGLRNVLENACKFARSQISVSLDQVGDHIVIVTSDDGIGFGDHLKVGEKPSFSSDGETRFGLSAAIRLIEARQGKVWIADPAENLGGASIALSVSGQIVG